jgi:hypothetical protein
MAVKRKVRVQFPALVQAESPVLLVKQGLSYTFSFDVNALIASITSLFLPVQTQQIITAGAATMASTDGLIVFNKTVGSASAVTVSPSLGKSGSCLVADFKGDAGTNNITITLTAPDVFPGGGSTWVIASDGGSVRLTPVPGIGYAI